MKKIKSFSDNIRRMFITYAIIPSFFIAFSCLALIIGIWKYTIKATNKTANLKVCRMLESDINMYSEYLVNLSKDETLITNPIDTGKRVKIMEVMYQLHSRTKCNADLYILDINLNPVFGDGALSELIINKTLDNWGIIREIRNKPDQISYYLINNKTNILCLGAGLQRNNELVGYLIITLDSEEFNILLSQVSSDIVVTDKNGWIYLISNYEFEDALGRFLQEYTYTSGFIEYSGETYYLSQNRICNDMFRVYSITNYSMESRMFKVMIMFILFLFVAIIGITFAISKKVAVKSTRDLYKIVEAFEYVKKGNLDHNLDIDSCIEFKEIGEAYNLMLDGLKNYIQENKELSHLAAFAQVKQLEAQFNSHFLFNTLDNIRFMSKIDVEAADKMIVALSNLLRYSISNAQEEIQLKEDLHYTESYLTILKIRYNSRLTYAIDVDENIKDCLIPKLMMLSLIENAVKYGYGDRETLHVSIKGFKKDDDLIFICKDNGAGIPEEILKQIRDNLMSPVNKTNHHGIYNIHRRIKLMYHNNYGVSIESKPGEGTTITLKLPYHTANDNYVI